MSQSLPHFATISYAFRHRFGEEVIEGVFRWILEEVAKAGYLSPEVVYCGWPHIKANANLKKHIRQAIPQAARNYEKQLMEEVNADREAHGRKPFKDDNAPSSPAGKEIMQHRIMRHVLGRMDFSSDAIAKTEGLLAVNRGFCKPQRTEKTSPKRVKHGAVLP